MGILLSPCLAGSLIHLFMRIGKGERPACNLKLIHITWNRCRLRQRHGHSVAAISYGGGHKGGQAMALHKERNYARATRATMTPNKK